MKPITILKAINDIDDRYLEEALQKQPEGRIRKFFRMPVTFKLAASAAALVLVAVVVTFSTGVTGLKSADSLFPYVSFDTVQKAEEYVGFTLEAPDSLLDSSSRMVGVENQQVMELIYLDGDGNRLLTIRKSAEYSDDIIENKNDSHSQTAGNEEYKLVSLDDDTMLVSWDRDDYHYEILFGEGVTPGEEQIRELIGSVK